MKKVYPKITVNFNELAGRKANYAWSILGLCVKEMHRAGCTQEQVNEFTKEARSGGYDHLLQTVLKYFNVVRH